MNSTHVDLLGRALDLGICDFAMVNDHGPPSVSVGTRGSQPPMLLREEGLGVGEEQDIIALGTIDLAPGVHDPSIIACDGGHNVHTLVLELAALLEVGRKVVGLAARRESAYCAIMSILLLGRRV